MIPGLGRSPGEGKGYPLQYSGLENFVDCIVHSVAKSGTRLSDFHWINRSSEFRFSHLLSWISNLCQTQGHESTLPCCLLEMNCPGRHMTKQEHKGSPLLRRGAHLESSRVFNPTSEVRGGSREDQPQVQGAAAEGTGGPKGATPSSRSGGATPSKVRSSGCVLLEQP